MSAGARHLPKLCIGQVNPGALQYSYRRLCRLPALIVDQSSAVRRRSPHAQDSATAKRVAFDRGVQTRCVTLDGDDFNPGGTLTGGSRAAGGSVLTRLVELSAAESDLASHRAALDAAKKALRDMAAPAKQHATCVRPS